MFNSSALNVGMKRKKQAVTEHNVRMREETPEEEAAPIKMTLTLICHVDDWSHGSCSVGLQNAANQTECQLKCEQYLIIWLVCSVASHSSS